MNYSFLSLIALVAFSFQACKNTVDDNEHEHAEAIGFYIKNANNERVITYLNLEVSGSFSVNIGEFSPYYTISFIDDDNDEFVPTGDEYSLKFVSSSDLFQFQNSPTNKWSFRIEGLKAGENVFELQLLHGDHPDFRSKPITVVVNQPDAN